MISETLRCFPNPVKRHPTHVQDMGANVARRATRDSSGEIIVQAKMTRASRGEKGMASEQELEQVARDVNVLASFLGTRDVPSLTPRALDERYGVAQADVMALFGGSILAGGDVLADAMRAGVARTYVIVGGAGHTTETFREKVRELCPDLTFAGDATEAQIFSSYVSHVHGLKADLLETSSTNCGNNITYLRDLLADRGIPCKSLILSQDATMQRRMVALAAKEMPGVLPIAFATYSVRVTVRDGELAYDHAPLGMWDTSRYLTLLMGEIPRLTDDENGYGPRGKGFLAHVDIPMQVRGAWDRLLKRYPWSMRTADPRYAG